MNKSQQQFPTKKAMKEDWHHEPHHPYSPKPHELSSKEEFYSNVAKKKLKPDPATVEAILQQEEELWNQ
jgi:hypothetical protein